MSPFVTLPTTSTTATSNCRRNSCAFGRHRTAARAILSYSQRVTPAGHFVNWQQDPQGNYVARLTFPERVRRTARRGRSRRRNGGLRSLRLLSRAVRRTVPVLLRRCAAPGTAAVPARRARRRRGSRTTCRRDQPPAAADRRLAGGSQSQLQSRHPLRRAARPRRADGRRDAAAAVAARAATRRGCSCNSAGTSGSPRGSYPAISFSSWPT